MNRIYLDYASTTPVRKEVVEEMQKYFSDEFGNPSSVHSLGENAKKAVEEARRKIARVLGCNVNEVIFTSGGTESNNLALKGFTLANKTRGKHIIVSKIEHDSVIEPCKWLEKNGFKVSYVDIGKNGIINPCDVLSEIRNDTILISIMYVNNELGTIQPIKNIVDIAHAQGIAVHTDACQATGYLGIDVCNLGVDLMTLNSGKICGPKGAGALFIRQGIDLEPIIHGGGQETGIRNGTENVPAIVGFGKAIELAAGEKENEIVRLKKLRNKLIDLLINKIRNTKLNGDLNERLPNNINITIPGIEAETLLTELSKQGIYASAGSACATTRLQPSHVLKAIGLSDKEAFETIRLSLGKYTTEEDVVKAGEKMVEIVDVLEKII